LSLKPVQRIVQVNGEPGIVSYVNGRAQSVFTLQVNDGHIDAIFIVTNPGKLSHLPPAAS
jgi:RNA polymerase sigma-70 factor (ECF subfamily)